MVTGFSLIMLDLLLAVYNHWTGLVDRTDGLTLKIIFYTSNETHLPVGLHDASYIPQNTLFFELMASYL